MAFTLFGSDAAEQAANANRLALARYGATAGPALETYRGGTLGALGTGYQTSLDALRSALAGETGAYTTAYAPVTPAAGAAATTLGSIGQGYQGDIDAYRDAMGLNGPEGVARAQARFTTGPGYQFQVDEATKAAANKAASLGIAGSGNTLDAIRARAQGIASGEYGDYLTRLAGYANPLVQLQYQARTGAATLPYEASKFVAGGTAPLIGGAYGRYGGDVSGLATGYGRDVGSVLGNVYQGTTATARDIASGNIAANNLVAQAGMQDAANFWNLMGNVAGAATKAAFPRVG